MSAPPRVSVVITAHNAAGTIAACLRSVAAQQGVAPGELEIVLVDDRSEDGTDHAAQSVHLTNWRFLRVTEYTPGPLTARQVALDRGFRAARGDVIFVTDADAVVPPDWIARTLGRLEATAADAVAGPVEFRSAERLRGPLQTVDSLYYLSVARILNALGFAAGLLFAHCAFRREVYARIGGFEGTGFALTEDLAFARALRRHGFRLVFQSHPLVSVGAAPNWGDLVRRAQRTSAGGVSALSVALGAWILPLPLLAVGSLVAGPLALQLFLLRYALGAAFTALAVLAARRFSFLPHALIYEPVAVLIGLRVLGLVLRRRQVEWGGVQYGR